jgi:hypothetical protein
MNLIERLRRRFTWRARRAASITERVLSAVSRHHKPVRFVQVGSNDADHGDPLRECIRAGGWTGSMIEPVPYVYDRLVQKWRDMPAIAFINCAIDESAGVRNFYYLEHSDDPLPAWYDQLGSFHLDNILKHREYIPDIDQRVRSIAIECRSVADVVPDDVTVFHCDVEGHDHRIVTALLAAGRRPDVVLFEHIHVSACDLKSLSNLLRDAGYLWAEDGHNTVAVRRANMRLSKLIATIESTERIVRSNG